jgi:hypothetical protein
VPLPEPLTEPDRATIRGLVGAVSAYDLPACLPGRVAGLRYEVRPGRGWVVHVADPPFLRAWLEHPHSEW